MFRSLFRANLAWLVLISCSVASGRANDDAKPISLFDGQTLNGWHKVGGEATFRVENGEIVGTVGPGANTFLRTDKSFGDFVLTLEFKLDEPGNSGIQIRSHQREGDGRVYGYQCEIDPSERAWSGGIYDEARRGWLVPLTGNPEAQQAFKLRDWNTFVIEAQGPRIRTWLNGVLCADLLDTMDLEGFIALQVHSGRQGQIRWRNIRLKDLGRTDWQPVWDGQSLDGWRAIGGGEWTVENGELRGSTTRSDARHGLLRTEEEFADFAVRLQFLAIEGNSGLYFRCAEDGGDLGVLGFQAEIDPAEDVGGIYETGGQDRGWIARPKAEDLEKWFKPSEWNELSVVALRDRFVVHLNGWETAAIVEPDSRAQGPIALQLHGAQDVDVRFKGIEIIRLDDYEYLDAE